MLDLSWLIGLVPLASAKTPFAKVFLMFPAPSIAEIRPSIERRLKRP
jgi:hypothetical protein